MVLPLAARREAHTREAAPAPARAPSRRVLVVEDNVPVADGMRFLLQHLRHDVRIAGDGAAGLEAIRDFRPDVVLCDIGLPGEVDGYALARAVRSDPAVAGTCLIAISGYGQASDRERAREAGFDLHVTKPVHPVRLEELLRSLPRRSDDQASTIPSGLSDDPRTIACTNSPESSPVGRRDSAGEPAEGSADDGTRR